MPKLTRVRPPKLDDKIVYSYTDRIYLGQNTCYIGDYSFSDLPNVNLMQRGIIAYPEYMPVAHQLYLLPYTLRDIGRGSLGYVNGMPSAAYIDGEPPPSGMGLASLPSFMARYAWANRLPTRLALASNPVGSGLPSEDWPTGMIANQWDGAVDENDVQALLEYLNLPIKVSGPGPGSFGNPFTSDIDFSGKVDHKDLILLRRRVAGWEGLDGYFDRDYLLEVRENNKEGAFVPVYFAACEANYTAATGLELEVGDASVQYEDGAIVRVPVRSVSNSGYISGSVTAKWNADAMELIDIEYRNALAPENGTGAIDNGLRYTLSEANVGEEAVTLDGAGEHVIRFGDDFRSGDITGTGELFTLVFRLREGAKPDAYGSSQMLYFEVGLKGFDIYDASLNFVRTELTRAGTVTVGLGDSVIREIRVANIVPPFAGQKLSYTFALPSGAPYQLMTEYSEPVTWLIPDPISRVEKCAALQAGKKYMVMISLKPVSDAFRFAGSEELRGIINESLEAQVWVNDSGTEASLSYTFTCADGIPLNYIVLNKTGDVMTAGDSMDLRVAACDPYNADDLGVVWTSSDPDVASVDAGGRVTARRQGSAVITATALNGGRQASCQVTVNRREHTVSSVCITNVTEPFIGQLQSNTAAVPPGTDYRISEKSPFGGGVVWLLKLDDKTSTPVSKKDAFQPGKEYKVWVYVETKETDTDVYLFPREEEMTATLNGLEARIQWVSDDGRQACVEYVFTRGPWSFDKSTRSITAGNSVGSERPVIVASYAADGRYLGSVFVMSPGVTDKAVKDGAASVAIFWLDRQTGEPLWAAETVAL